MVSATEPCGGSPSPTGPTLTALAWGSAVGTSHREPGRGWGSTVCIQKPRGDSAGEPSVGSPSWQLLLGAEGGSGAAPALSVKKRTRPGLVLWCGG